MTLERSVDGVLIRVAREDDLANVDRVFRLAFGTFLGLEDPSTFSGDRQLARQRWLVEPESVVVAELDGAIVGSNFAANWGSVGWFGPLTIDPELWNRGVAQRLLDATMQIFDRWGTAHAGLFTFPQSTKHVHLYQRYGFWPRFLTAIVSKDVEPPSSTSDFTLISSVPDRERPRIVAACSDLTGSIYGGLDLRREIESVVGQQLGDTLLRFEGDRLAAFAICHFGPNSEADAGICYAKFAAVRPGLGAGTSFDGLLDSWNALAHTNGLNRLLAGVNMARHDAYTQLLNRGFRTQMQGVTMHRPDDAGYDRADVYILDDWR